MLAILWELGRGTVVSLRDMTDDTIRALLNAEEQSSIRLLVR